MGKIIREILVLAWKALQLLFWKWLTPIVRRLFFYAVVAIGLVMLIVFVATRI